MDNDVGGLVDLWLRGWKDKQATLLPLDGRVFVTRIDDMIDGDSMAQYLYGAVVGFTFLLYFVMARDLYERTGIIAIATFSCRALEIRHHSTAGVIVIYAIMFLVSFLFLFVPLRDQMNCCTRVAYEKDKRYSWLLRLEGKPYDTIVFRVNMYTFMTGLFCIALCTYFLCWDVVTNLSPANH